MRLCDKRARLERVRAAFDADCRLEWNELAQRREEAERDAATLRKGSESK